MKRPTYLLTLLRNQQACIDLFAEPSRLSPPFPLDTLPKHLQPLPVGDWFILDDLTDLLIECIRLPGVRSRAARVALRHHHQQHAPNVQLTHIERVRGSPEQWLLQTLQDTPENTRSALLSYLHEQGHRISCLISSAHLLCQAPADHRPSHSTPSPQLFILPDVQDSLLVLSQSGQIRFARVLRETPPERAMQTILPTLQANRIIPPGYALTPRILPSTQARAALRRRVLQGERPKVKFLSTPQHRATSWALLALTSLLCATVYAISSTQAPAEITPPPVPPLPLEERFPKLLATLHQPLLAADSALARLVCTWQNGTFLLQGFDESDSATTLNSGTTEPTLGTAAHWHTTDRLQWMQHFQQQHRWPRWRFQLNPDSSEFSLEFSSRHDAQAFSRLQTLTSTSPDQLEPQRCTFSLQPQGLHTRCLGHWSARTDFPATPTTQTPAPFHDWPPLFWDASERQEMDRLATDEARRGGWLLRSDGLKLRWHAGGFHGQD